MQNKETSAAVEETKREDGSGVSNCTRDSGILHHNSLCLYMYRSVCTYRCRKRNKGSGLAERGGEKLTKGTATCKFSI